MYVCMYLFMYVWIYLRVIGYYELGISVLPPLASPRRGLGLVQYLQKSLVDHTPALPRVGYTYVPGNYLKKPRMEVTGYMSHFCLVLLSIPTFSL
jgi:hypothetical protein